MVSHRVFTAKRRIRVGDCDSNGNLRVDAIARYLQDIGYDDTDDIGVGDGGFWVARSIEMDFSDVNRWPKRNEFITMQTYCSGIGKAFAQRCVDITTANGEVIHTLTMWVSINEQGKPSTVPQWLIDAYPKAEKVSAKRTLQVIEPSDEFDGNIISWPLRASDLDVNNHVNNAVAFDALYEAAQAIDAKLPRRVLIEYHQPLESTDDTSIYLRQNGLGFDAWFANDKNVAAVMKWEI